MCRALSRWQAARDGGYLPLVDDFDPGADGPLADGPLADHLYLIHLGDSFALSVFGHCGRWLAELCVRPPAGLTLAEALPAPFRDAMIDFMAGAVRYRQPLADSGSFLLGDGSEILYRNILMPLGDRSGMVTALLGAFSRKDLS